MLRETRDVKRSSLISWSQSKRAEVCRLTQHFSSSFIAVCLLIPRGRWVAAVTPDSQVIIGLPHSSPFSIIPVYGNAVFHIPLGQWSEFRQRGITVYGGANAVYLIGFHITTTLVLVGIAVTTVAGCSLQPDASPHCARFDGDSCENVPVVTHRPITQHHVSSDAPLKR